MHMQTRADLGISRTEVAIIVAIVAIIAAVALPGVWRARMAKNEAGAIASLRMIVAAEIAYASVCGRNRYASSLSTLGVPPAGGTQAFLAAHLAVPAPEHDGFRFTLRQGEGAQVIGADCNGTPTSTAYYGSAVPTTFGRTGTRSFGVNTAGTIWQNVTAAAPAEPFGAPTTPIQ